MGIEDEEVTRGISVSELRVFELLLDGMRNREIADSLGLSEKTVEEHLTNIYKKIGVKCRTQAVLFYISQLRGFPD